MQGRNPAVAVDVRDGRGDGAGKSENTVDGFALWLWRVSPRPTQPTIDCSPAPAAEELVLWLRLGREA